MLEFEEKSCLPVFVKYRCLIFFYIKHLHVVGRHLCYVPFSDNDTSYDRLGRHAIFSSTSSCRMSWFFNLPYLEHTNTREKSSCLTNTPYMISFTESNFNAPYRQHNFSWILTLFSGRMVCHKWVLSLPSRHMYVANT